MTTTDISSETPSVHRNDIMNRAQNNYVELMSRLSMYCSSGRSIDYGKAVAHFLQEVCDRGETIDFSFESKCTNRSKTVIESGIFGVMFGEMFHADVFRLLIRAGFQPTKQQLGDLLDRIIDLTDDDSDTMLEFVLEMGADVMSSRYFTLWLRILAQGSGGDDAHFAMRSRALDRVLDCVYPMRFDKPENYPHLDWRDIAREINVETIKAFGQQYKVELAMQSNFIDYVKWKKHAVNSDPEHDLNQPEQCNLMLSKLKMARDKFEKWLRECRQEMTGCLVSCTDICAPVLRIMSEYM